MDKSREAFEKLPVIEEIMGDDYVMFDERFKKYLCGVGANEEYLNGAWMAWQSRQAEVDDLKNLLEKDEYAHNLYYENANLQTLVEEKDKRITEILFVIARAKDGYYGYSKDGGDTDNLVFDLEKALGGNNANS